MAGSLAKKHPLESGWVHDEVDKQAENEHDDLLEKGSKKKLEEASHKGFSLKQLRQSHWIRRYTGGSREGWRSAPLRRVAAKRWCCNLDAQIRMSLGLPGLVFFCPDGDLARKRGHWTLWPHLGIAADYGSDGMSGYMSLERKFLLNVDWTGEPSHNANRDNIGALRESSLYSFWLCCLISWNVPFGPNKDDMRYSELREHLRLTISQGPHENLLFQHDVRQLAACYRRNGHVFNNEASLEEQVWKKLKERQWFVKSGYRGNVCRFLSLIAVPRQNVPWWEVDCFERTSCGLREGYLSSSSFEKRIKLRVDRAEVAGEASTDPSRINLEDRTLRSAVQNAVAWSVVLLNDNSNKRICFAVLELMIPSLIGIRSSRRSSEVLRIQRCGSGTRLSKMVS